MDENKPKGPKPLVGRRKRKLYSKIKSQMEFYFSDSNLAKDNFLSSLIQKNDQGYVDLEVFKSFNKIKTITTDLGVIIDALSRSNILKVSEDGTKVKRITATGSPKDFDACTIYVEKLPSYADHKWIKDVFEHFGVVDFISIPRHKTSKKIKGFAFVEFNNPGSVAKACEFYTTDGKVNESEEENNDSKLDRVRKAEDDSERKAEDDGERKAKKRKLTMESANDDKVEHVSKDCDAKGENTESHSDKRVLLTSRKRKIESHEEEVPSKKTHLAVDSSSDQEVERTNMHEQDKQDCSAPDGDVNSEDETPGKNKRKRKHKKKHHSHSERLRVMSKQEWKSYRNKYLNLQRSTMSYLKKQIMLETQAWKENEANVKTEAPKKVQFQKGVIIKINLKDPIENATSTKDQVKANAVVAYIDAPLGHTDMYVRCHTPDEALSIVQEEKLQNLGAVELLKGSEEEEYWKKIENDRLVRYNMPPQKKRGRDKLIAKAAKLLEQKNKHIYFDE